MEDSQDNTPGMRKLTVNKAQVQREPPDDIDKKPLNRRPLTAEEHR